MKKSVATLFWLLFALLGAWAYAVLAFRRGEPVNSAYLLIAAICTYAIGFRFYSKWIAARVLALDNRRATPCVVHDDGKDFVKTNRWVVFGHHFAAIAGPGPLVGPVLAAQFGYLPGALWILIGVVLGGAVQDFVILFCSIRRDGKSLAQMVKEELNSPAGAVALLAILAILVILLAVLALVVVKALAESPWGVFTVGATIPIALLMGGYMRFVRVGKVLEASAFGVALLLLAVWGGKLVYQNPHWSQFFSLHGITLAWIIIGYGVISSSLPVWMLLAPRDYLSTFMKLGTILLLALGILLVLPSLQMAALTPFTDGSGLVVAGKVFPFCFITIACGAVSGFHALIASGTTPKMITRERYARHIGYGAMCCESFVAVMALIAACTLQPGVYLSMNVKGDPAATVAQVSTLNYPVTVDEMNSLANEVGEKTLFGRTGGAATLAVGMAQIFSKAVSGRWLDLWYHFAIMFEALFILTTLDAGTRVGRYLLQGVLGRVWKPLGNPKNYLAEPVAAALMVGAWGYFLIQGVRDPLGGINSLWPLFGIANQLLAAIALCLGTTIILKMQFGRDGVLPSPIETSKSESLGQRHAVPPRSGKPALALITLVPLMWLVAVTFTAGVEKIYHPDPRIGFLAQAAVLHERSPALESDLSAANSSGDAAAIATAEKELRSNRALEFNNLLDAAVAGTFLVQVTAIIGLSVREWILLLTRRKPAVLHETEPVWLPDYALKEAGPDLRTVAGTAAIAFGLAKELSGEAHFERARQQACECARPSDQQIFTQATEARFSGVRRCC
jgi:carbon starvation protein